MNIRANRYNDPSLGAAFESLAGMFAPMSGSDVAGYAAADLNRQQAARQAQQLSLIDMFANGEGPINDRTGIAAGLYTPNQSWGAVQMGDATNRRGQDLSHGASIYGHDQALAGTKYTSDNTLKGNIFGHVSAPLAQGEVRQVPDDVAAWATGGNVGGIDQVGAPKPLSKTEVEGQLLGQAALDDPDFANWVLGGSNNPIAAVDADSNAILARPHEAAGMGVYEDRSKIPGIKSVRTPDGRVTGAVEDHGGYVEARTGNPLPAGTIPFSANATGDADAMGLGRTPQNRIQTDLLEVEAAKSTANRLLPLLQENPGALGAVGWLQGTAQDAISTGGEIGQLFGNGYHDVFQDIQNGVADAGLIGAGGVLNPALPRIDFLKNLFVYQIAKVQSGERLSNEDVKNWRQSLGLDGGLSNAFRGSNALDEAITMLNTREATLRQSLEQNSVASTGPVPGLGDGSTTTPPPTNQAGGNDDLFRKYGLQP